MRIALLTTEYPTENVFAGGLANYVRRIAHALLGGGHEAEVFTLSHVTGRTTDGPVSVHRVRSTAAWKAWAAGIPLAWRSAGYAEMLAPAWRLARALRRRHRQASFDVVQAASFRACGLWAAFQPVAPLVTRLSSFEPLWRAAAGQPTDRAARQRDRVEVLQLRRSAAVYAPSSLLAETVSRRLGVDVRVIEPPVFLVEEGCEPLPPGLAPGGYGLFFGSMGRLKGCDRLVRILPELLRRHADFKFVFVGQVFPAEGGQPFDELIAERLEAYRERVVVLRERHHPSLLPLVRGARLVVLPSRIDNLPNTCLEAMALCRIVIATREASFEQLITDTVSGFLVSQDDDAELAAVISRVWTMDERQRRAMGHEARRRMQRLDPATTTADLVSFFEDVVDSDRRRR